MLLTIFKKPHYIFKYFYSCDCDGITVRALATKCSELNPNLHFSIFYIELLNCRYLAYFFLQLGVIFRDTNAYMLKRLFYGKVNIKAH